MRSRSGNPIKRVEFFALPVDPGGGKFGLAFQVAGNELEEHIWSGFAPDTGWMLHIERRIDRGMHRRNNAFVEWITNSLRPIDMMPADMNISRDQHDAADLLLLDPGKECIAFGTVGFPVIFFFVPLGIPDHAGTENFEWGRRSFQSSLEPIPLRLAQAGLLCRVSPGTGCL